MKNNIKLITILFIIGYISGCNMMNEQLRCHPIESNECIGWLGDKPIYDEL